MQFTDSHGPPTPTDAIQPINEAQEILGRTDIGRLWLAGTDGAGAAKPPRRLRTEHRRALARRIHTASTPPPHSPAQPHRVTMLADWVDDVASALRLRRAPLLPLSSSDRPRSHIRCDGFWIWVWGSRGQRQCLRLPTIDASINPQKLNQKLAVARDAPEPAVGGARDHLLLAGPLPPRGHARLRRLRVRPTSVSSSSFAPSLSLTTSTLTAPPRTCNSSSSTRASLVCTDTTCTFERHRGQHARAAAALAAAHHHDYHHGSNRNQQHSVLKRAAAGLPPQAAVERAVFPREHLLGAAPTRTRNGEAVDFE